MGLPVRGSPGGNLIRTISVLLGFLTPGIGYQVLKRRWAPEWVSKTRAWAENVVQEIDAEHDLRIVAFAPATFWKVKAFLYSDVVDGESVTTFNLSDGGVAKVAAATKTISVQYKKQKQTVNLFDAPTLLIQNPLRGWRPL
jgi:hypothetical protein